MKKLTTSKNVGGSSKYTAEVLITAQQYADCYETVYGDAIPSLAGLALVLKISKLTLNIWDKDKEKQRFSQIISQIENKQEVILLNKGLLGEFNSGISKLVLTKHGYSDKQDNKITGDFNVTINAEDAGTL